MVDGVAFGGGGARACAITAGVLSAVVMGDVVVSANSGATWAIARWLRGAFMWTPENLDAQHPRDHVLYATTATRILPLLAHVGVAGPLAWFDSTSKIIATNTERRNGPPFICCATLFTRQPQLLELTEEDGWDLVDMCAHSTFAASPELHTHLTFPTFGGYPLVDGGFTDNLAVAPLVRRGCRRIVSIVNTPIPLSDSTDTSQLNDISRLFGWRGVVKGVSQHVFPAKDYSDTIKGLVDSKGIFTRAYSTDYGECTVTWVYITRDSDFIETLQPCLKARMRDDFPHLPTQLTFDPFDANLLFLYGRFIGTRLQSVFGPPCVSEP
jgi:hypothetical protein